MNPELNNQIIVDVLYVYEQQRKLAEGALAQITDEQFFHTPAPEANSLAVIVKHVGGNLRSRWTDFLTSDGEKPDRNRDGEFVVDTDTRADIMRVWDTGWSALNDALASLSSSDLSRTVTIRAVPHTVSQALMRSLAHTAHHCGQVVHLAKQLAGEGWQTLSIPRGGSRSFNPNLWK